MYSTRFSKFLLVPAAVIVSQQEKDKLPKPQLLRCRPSELPIYVPEAPQPQQRLQNREVGAPEIPSYLEETFGTVRQHFTSVLKEIKAYQRVGVDYLQQGQDNAEYSLRHSENTIAWKLGKLLENLTQNIMVDRNEKGFDLKITTSCTTRLFKYLREEDNTTPKAGAIAIGGLTGLIFGLRGGFLKRTIYAATGALGMASICYPKEASEYSEVGITEARKYATIAYNFAYGDQQEVKDQEKK